MRLLWSAHGIGDPVWKGIRLGPGSKETKRWRGEGEKGRGSIRVIVGVITDNDRSDRHKKYF